MENIKNQLMELYKLDFTFDVNEIKIKEIINYIKKRNAID